MNILTASAVLLVLSAVVSFRRARSLPRDRQGRFARVWPFFVAALVTLGLIGFQRVQEQDYGPSATIDLMLLVGAFAAGWFIGVFVDAYDEA